jgi:hypothetical protein
MLKILTETDIIIQLFCVVDDLCKEIEPRMLPKSSNAGAKPKLKTSELIAIGVIFLFCDCNTFKGFYHLMKLNNMFPNMPEYSRLLRNVKNTIVITMIILRILININRSMSDKKIKFVDSMPSAVCNNKRIFNYCVTDVASRGKSSMGWFYGFKLHVVIDQNGKLLGIRITPGNVSDKDHDLINGLFEGLKGVIVGDAGYLSKPLQAELLKKGILFITGAKKNMHVLMSDIEHHLLKMRQLIETVNGRIKYRCSCVSSVPRSLLGYLWRYVTSVFTFVLISSFI